MILGLHHDIREFQEHGATWYECYTCGAQWDEHDEQVTEGDHYCEEHPQ